MGMPADRIHLIRHGEVHNPDGVLYGRLPNFNLSDRGRAMALAAAEDLVSQGRKISKLFASPLTRTQQSAEPVSRLTGLEINAEPRVIEPSNRFEGYVVGLATVLRHPEILIRLVNPLRPSWGEPYRQIVKRMFEAIEAAEKSVDDGDVVLVSHQLPIEMVRRTVAGKLLPHNPRNRRCSLSSITTLERIGGKWVEVDYREPAAKVAATDRGAA